MKKTLFFGILAMLISMAAKAQDDITYIDENGDSQVATSATVIDGTITSALSDGWYYVSSATSLTGDLEISGDVNLILDEDLTISGNIVIPSGASLTIYGTTEVLSAQATLTANNINVEGTLTINGHLKVTTTTIGSDNATISILGGHVITSTTGDDETIIANSLTLGYKSLYDRIECSDIEANDITIADGCSYLLDGSTYSGTLHKTDILYSYFCGAVLSYRSLDNPSAFFDNENFSYKFLDNATVAVSGFASGVTAAEAENLIIPSSVTENGITYTVTKIGNHVFTNNHDIKEVTIPSTVVEIGYWAFGGCSLLATVTIAEGSVLETIGECAFYTTALTEITLPASIKSIGKEAFNTYDIGWNRSFTLICKATIAPLLGSGAFPNKDDYCGSGKGSLEIVPDCGSGYSEWAQYFEEITGGINVTETTFSTEYSKEYDGTAIMTYSEGNRQTYNYEDGKGNRFSITPTAVTFLEDDGYGNISSSPYTGTNKLVRITYDMSQTVVAAGEDACPNTEGNVITLKTITGSITYTDDIYVLASGTKTFYVGVHEDGDVVFTSEPQLPSNVTVEYQYDNAKEEASYVVTTNNAAGANYVLTSDDGAIVINLHVGEPYAEFSSDGKTLYFRYGARPTDAFPMPEYDAFPGWSFASQISTVKKVDFESVITPTTCYEWFRGFTNLTTIDHIENLHTENVKEMSYMFDGCSKLAVIDISNFDMSSVEKMDYMFADCINLTTILVKASQLDDSEDKYLKLKGNVSHKGVFKNCYNLIGNTGSLYDMVAKAHYAATDAQGFAYNDKEYDKAGEGGYLTIDKCKIFYDLYADDEIDLETVAGAITEYEGGTEVTLPTVSSDLLGTFGGWVRTTLNVEGGAYSVVHASTPTNSIAADEKGNRIYSAKWAKAKEKYVFFDNNTLYFKYDLKKPSENAYSLNEGSAAPRWLEQHSSDIKKVVFETSLTPTTCYRWFYGCSNLKALDLTNIKTAALTNTESMFEGCNSLTAILVDNNQWSSIKNYYITQSANMFNGCSSLIGERGRFIYSDVVDKNFAYAKDEDYDGYFTCDNFKIFYDLDGGNFEDDNIDSPIEYDAEIELETPTQDGYTFLGWAKAIGYEEYEYIYDTELLTDPTIPANSGNYYLKAVWGEQYAELSEDGKTLTFKVGVKPEDDYNCFDLPTDNPTPAWLTAAASTVETVVFESTITPVSCKQWFANFSELKEIKDMDKYLDTKNVNSYEGMFSGCKKLESIDVSYFTPAKDYGWMFSGCEQLQTITLGNIVNETANDIKYMFHDCSSLEEINVSGFNTTNVKDMSYLFDDCRSLKSVNVSNFSTDNVTDMSYMFSACKSLKVLDISNFNTAAVTNMSWMFADCDNLTTIRVGDGWNTSNIKIVDAQTRYLGWNLFRFDYALIGNDGTFCNVREYGTDPYIDYQYAHANDGGYLTKGNYKIFYDKDAGDDKIQIETIDGAPTEYVSANGIDELPTLEESDENGEFEYWVSITRSADEIVTGPSANSIAAGEIGNKIYSAKWALTKEKYVYYDDYYKTLYFRFDANKPAGAYSLNNGSEAPGWLEHSNDIENIVIEGEIAPTSCYQWFKGCYKVKTIDLSNLITDKVTNMESMFEDCSSLTGINIAHFKRDRLTNIKYMFRNCSSLTGILVDPDQWKREDMWWQTDYLESEEMFAGCDMLIGEEGTWAGAQYCDGLCDNDNNPHTDDKRFAFAKPYSECDGGNFTEGNFKIYYDLDGGVLNGESDPDPQEYDDDTELATPTNDGYVLAGWLQAIGYEKVEDEHGYKYIVPTYPDSYEQSDLITSVAKNSGNYRLKAVWGYNIFLPEGFAATDASDNAITTATEGQTITLTYTGTKYVKKVEVFPMPKSVSIDQAGALGLFVRGTATLTCTILPTGIADEDKVVKWTSSDETIVKIGLNTGTMEGVSVGNAIITVETTNGKKATVSVEVRDN